MSKKGTPAALSEMIYLLLKFIIITPDMPLTKTYINQLPELISMVSKF